MGEAQKKKDTCFLYGLCCMAFGPNLEKTRARKEKVLFISYERAAFIFFFKSLNF